jgi:hypothetical protein
MLTTRAVLLLAAVTVSLAQAPQLLLAQGKGGGKGEGKGHGGGQPAAQEKGRRPDKARGNDQADKGRGKGPEKRAAPGRSDAAKISAASKAKGSATPRKFARPVSVNTMPASVRRYAASNHARDIVAAAAVAHAIARGRGNDVRIENAGDRVRILNNRGDPLLFIDDRTAENLGRWRVDVVDDDVREGAPAFCRSGAGHPVWGREWCIDKGFGLGDFGDYRWGRTTDVGDIIYRRGTLGDRIVGTALEALLGPTAFNRLALHAVTLGLLDPLVGRFVGEPSGPQYLVVNSGTYPVAELYDDNRDSRWDNLLVALRPW